MRTPAIQSSEYPMRAPVPALGAVLGVILLLVCPARILAQAEPPQPPHISQWQIDAGGKQEFDVASVRLNKNPDDPSSLNVPYGADDAFHDTGGIFSAKNWPLVGLIAFAYKNTTAQRDAFRASLPDWALADGFNIEARTENHALTKDQMRLMVQSLLEDRFKLKVHYETRPVSVYAVMLIKPGVLGPGLRPHPADDPCSPIAPPPGRADPDGPPPAPLTVAGGFPTRCGSFVNMPPSAPYLRHEGARNISIAKIVSTFTGMGNLGRPVIDKTGLTGNFDWVMEFIDERPGRNPPPDADGPTIQEALKNQLGLKLVPQKAPFEFLIVDHVEQPTEN
jgi:uncharacterized protein (TIGR03435 family)